MNFFVSGASGFIGSHFLNILFKNDHNVVALRRNFSVPKIPLIKEPNWCTGKLTDNWATQLKKCDVFVHLHFLMGVGLKKFSYQILATHCTNIFA